MIEWRSGEVAKWRSDHARGQSSLEFVIGVAAALVLLVGMTKLWAWGTGLLVARTQQFEDDVDGANHTVVKFFDYSNNKLHALNKDAKY